ncbi:MAG: YIP1 family protein [Candidatus Wallacebacter cryptica]|nr:hypothetical protein [Bacillota bacterium]
MKTSRVCLSPNSRIWFGTVSLVLIMAFMVLPVSAAEAPYQSYIYDQWGNPVPTPTPYVVEQVISGDGLGIGRLNNPQDLFICDDGTLYVVDSRNNRIIHLDQELSLVRIIDGFESETGWETFNNPYGIFAAANGTLFIADTDNHRIVQLDQMGNLEQIITYVKPEGLEIEIVEFLPAKVVVDPVGRIFAAARNIFDGLMEFNADGTFVGFVGAPTVRPSLYDLFWYRFATKEQRERRAIFLPIEYTNVTLDRSGFIYAVAKDEVRRLNPTGLDVLNREGQWPVVGDVNLPPDTNSSFLTDITVNDYGIYHVLDSERGRIFAYDDRGELLYVFGAIGLYQGAFSRPRAIDTDGERLFVLDEQRGQITIFKPTDYAKSIHHANQLYMLGKFEESTEAWQHVLKYNNLYPLAYSGLGMSALRQGQYQEAGRYFRLGNNRNYYSKAFAYHRKDVIEENFLKIMVGVIAAVIGIVIIARIRSGREKTIYDASKVKGWRRLVDALRYALHVCVNPIEGFWDLRYEGRGSMSAAMIILLLASISLVFLKQYTAFLFNFRDVSQINIFGDIGTSAATFFLWCTINWALTTLMEGKGNFSDIVMATAYALTPLILINIPITILSNYLTLDEGSYYHFFYNLGIIWTGILIFCATMVTHHYTPTKTVGTCVLNIVGMGIVVFLGLLFLNMVSMLTEYFTTVYREIVYRL